MEVVFAIISIVAAVLQIILFFKLWGMTNDVRKLKDAVIGNFSQANPSHQKEMEAPPIEHMGISVGDYVIRKSDGKRMKVQSIYNNKLFCSANVFGGYKYYALNEIEKEND